MTKDLTTLIDQLILKGVPFAAYRLPNETAVHMVVQQSFELSTVKIGDLDSVSGFVIAAFESAKTGNVYVLKPDFNLDQNEDIEKLNTWLNSLPEHVQKQGMQDSSQEKEEYLNRVSYLIDQLKSGNFEKIVYSRIAREKLSPEISYAEFYMRLESDYPKAFVSIFSLPDSNIWIGASPESLIAVNGDQISTMAVAGTRITEIEGADIQWKKKEIEEQAYVSRFIEDQLSELSVVNYKKSGPHTFEAGSVSHLKTEFTIAAATLKGKTGRFIKGLHPTPAVCGLPKADAYLMIQKAETHNRLYYTGFLGPWKLNNHAHLFVNLRCAELYKDDMNLYLGGGLTADSVAKDEWEETLHKSKTLLSVAKKL